MSAQVKCPKEIRPASLRTSKSRAERKREKTAGRERFEVSGKRLATRELSPLDLFLCPPSSRPSTSVSIAGARRLLFEEYHGGWDRGERSIVREGSRFVRDSANSTERRYRVTARTRSRVSNLRTPIPYLGHRSLFARRGAPEIREHSILLISTPFSDRTVANDTILFCNSCNATSREWLTDEPIR